MLTSRKFLHAPEASDITPIPEGAIRATFPNQRITLRHQLGVGTRYVEKRCALGDKASGGSSVRPLIARPIRMIACVCSMAKGSAIFPVPALPPPVPSLISANCFPDTLLFRSFRPRMKFFAETIEISHLNATGIGRQRAIFPAFSLIAGKGNADSGAGRGGRPCGNGAELCAPAPAVISQAGRGGCEARAAALPSRAPARPSSNPRRAGSSGTARPRANSPRPRAA